MKESIRRQDLSSEYYTAEKCSIVELSNSADDEGLSIARAKVKPGVTTRWHRLKKSGERYYILRGTGRAEIGSLLPEDVRAGDVVVIGAGDDFAVPSLDSVGKGRACNPRRYSPGRHWLLAYAPVKGARQSSSPCASADRLLWEYSMHFKTPPPPT